MSESIKEWIESADISKVQNVHIVSEYDAERKIKAAAEKNWIQWNGWDFKKWWSRFGEDCITFCRIKGDSPSDHVKIKSAGLWYEKNDPSGIAKIDELIDKLTKEFVEKNTADHPALANKPNPPEGGTGLTFDDVTKDLLADYFPETYS